MNEWAEAVPCPEPRRQVWLPYRLEERSVEVVDENWLLLKGPGMHMYVPARIIAPEVRIQVELPPLRNLVITRPEPNPTLNWDVDFNYGQEGRRPSLQELSLRARALGGSELDVLAGALDATADGPELATAGLDGVVEAAGVEELDLGVGASAETESLVD